MSVQSLTIYVIVSLSSSTNETDLIRNKSHFKNWETILQRMI